MPNGHGFSFPYGVPLVIYPVLAVGIGVAAGRWWGLLLAGVVLVLAGIFTWEAFSKKEYEAVRANDPTMNIPTWRINWLLFFALPAWVLGILGIAPLLTGK